MVLVADAASIRNPQKAALGRAFLIDHLCKVLLRVRAPCVYPNRLAHFILRALQDRYGTKRVGFPAGATSNLPASVVAEFRRFCLTRHSQVVY